MELTAEPLAKIEILTENRNTPACHPEHRHAASRRLPIERHIKQPWQSLSLSQSQLEIGGTQSLGLFRRENTGAMERVS